MKTMGDNSGWPQMMRLHSGLHVDPLDIKPEEILIDDIAHGLSLENRFGGQTNFPVQVSLHSAYVSRLCELHGPDIALAGLLHDGSEAYLKDMITWVKNASGMEFYRRIEAELQMKIFAKFNIDYTEHTHRIVSKYDAFMCDVEGIKAFNVWTVKPTFNLNDDYEFGIVKHWMPVNWEAAKSMFLKQFNKLTKQIQERSNGQKTARPSF
jgi:hypothetical protein